MSKHSIASAACAAFLLAALCGGCAQTGGSNATGTAVAVKPPPAPASGPLLSAPPANATPAQVEAAAENRARVQEFINHEAMMASQRPAKQ
jgi:hypothetical protein